MDSNEESQVIVFDNLFRPSEIVGKFQQVEAVEPFTNANAGGEPRQVEKLQDIEKCAAESGRRLKAAFCCA